DADCDEDWSVLVSDEEMRPETVQAVPVVSRAVVGNTDTPRRPWMGWASKGLLLCTLILGTLIAGMDFFVANSIISPVTRQEFREVSKSTQAPIDKQTKVAEAE